MCVSWSPAIVHFLNEKHSLCRTLISWDWLILLYIEFVNHVCATIMDKYIKFCPSLNVSKMCLKSSINYVIAVDRQSRSNILWDLYHRLTSRLMAPLFMLTAQPKPCHFSINKLNKLIHVMSPSIPHGDFHLVSLLTFVQITGFRNFNFYLKIEHSQLTWLYDSRVFCKMGKSNTWTYLLIYWQ